MLFNTICDTKQIAVPYFKRPGVLIFPFPRAKLSINLEPAYIDGDCEHPIFMPPGFYLGAIEVLRHVRLNLTHKGDRVGVAIRYGGKSEKTDALCRDILICLGNWMQDVGKNNLEIVCRLIEEYETLLQTEMQGEPMIGEKDRDFSFQTVVLALHVLCLRDIARASRAAGARLPGKKSQNKGRNPRKVAANSPALTQPLSTKKA